MQEVSKRESFFRRKRVIFLFIVVISVIAELIYSNSHIDVEYITVSESSIPEGFDGCIIVQISDYHNNSEASTIKLIDKINEQNPDYIFLTGDICDGIRTNIPRVEEFLTQVSEIAPCYMVWGNHDMGIEKDNLEIMRKCAIENNIRLLENNYEYIERDNDRILITGTVNYLYNDKVEKMMKNYPDYDGFSIWLHHYPEDFSSIAEVSDTDLIFAGHAHGGLIRLPFTDGLYAPGQSFFPEYTSGLYEEYDTRMIVSRGVGNSGYTLRMFNPFHLVVCTLEKDNNS